MGTEGWGAAPGFPRNGTRIVDAITETILFKWVAAFQSCAEVLPMAGASF